MTDQEKAEIILAYHEAVKRGEIQPMPKRKPVLPVCPLPDGALGIGFYPEGCIVIEEEWD